MRRRSPYVVATLTFVALTALTLLIRFLSQNWSGLPPDFGSYICGQEDCTLQKWLAALSGYFALGAAVVAIWLTWGQLNELRRQTAFTLGDAKPTIALANPSQRNAAIVFQLLNWNRRPLALYEVRIRPRNERRPPCPQPTAIVYADHKITPPGWAKVRLKENGELERGKGMLGWIDRQQPPPGWWIELHFQEKAFDDFPIDNTNVYIIDFVFAQESSKGRRELFTLSHEVVTAFLSPKG